MIVKETLAQQIYKQLRKEIIKQQIPLGSKLVNRQLQDRFGVSSSPIRDAINKLHEDELIIELNNSGARVVDLEYDRFVQINEVLKYTIITGLKITKEKNNIQKLLEELKNIQNVIKEDVIGENYYEYDYDFHKACVDHSENIYLIKNFKKYNALNELLVREHHKDTQYESQEETFQTHIDIVEAIEDHDIDKAVDLTYDHYYNPQVLHKLKMEEKLKKT